MDNFRRLVEQVPETMWPVIEAARQVHCEEARGDVGRIGASVIIFDRELQRATVRGLMDLQAALHVLWRLREEARRAATKE